MTVSSITVNRIGAQRVHVPFIVSGTFVLNDATFVADLVISGVTSKASVTPGVSRFKFTHPGYGKAGTYAVTVTIGGVHAVSNKFMVR